MIKVYIQRSMVSHALKYTPGAVVVAGYTFLAISNKRLIGMQASYDPLIPQDIVAFAALVMIISIVLFLLVKSYIAFFPLTCITFGLDKIEIKDVFKKSSNLLWADVERIDLEVGDNRLLLLNIRNSSGETIECYMSHLWLLSISKTWCINHNFYRLMCIAGENQNLKSKLSVEQVQYMYTKTGVDGGVF